MQSPIKVEYVQAIVDSLLKQVENSKKISAISDFKNKDLQKLLCQISLTNICLLSRESQSTAEAGGAKKKAKKRRMSNASQKSKDSGFIANKSSEDPSGSAAEKMIAEKPADQGPESSAGKAIKTINLGKEFGNKLIALLQGIEDNRGGLISQWLFDTIEAIFAHFQSNQGTLTCSDYDNVVKKELNPPKISKADIEYYSSIWSPIFKRTEVVRREGSIFLELDQDLLTSTILLSCAIVSFGFKIKSDIEKWQNILGRLIFTPVTSNIATSFNKMLLKKICGDNETSYRVRDFVLFAM